MAPLVAVRIAAVDARGQARARALARTKSAPVASWAGALACFGGCQAPPVRFGVWSRRRLSIPALTWVGTRGAGDENRTRTISLGSAAVTAARDADLASLAVISDRD